jgi:hypothetical protein
METSLDDVLSFLDVPADIRHGIFRAIPLINVLRYVTQSQHIKFQNVESLEDLRRGAFVSFFAQILACEPVFQQRSPGGTV